MYSGANHAVSPLTGVKVFRTIHAALRLLESSVMIDLKYAYEIRTAEFCFSDKQTATVDSFSRRLMLYKGEQQSKQLKTDATPRIRSSPRFRIWQSEILEESNLSNPTCHFLPMPGCIIFRVLFVPAVPHPQLRRSAGSFKLFVFFYSLYIIHRDRRYQIVNPKWLTTMAWLYLVIVLVA